MKFKFYMMTVLLGLGFINATANAAWLNSSDVSSPVSLSNGGQSISFSFAPGTVEKLWWSNTANSGPDKDFDNQNASTIADEINEVFGANTVTSSSFVAQGDFNESGSGFSGPNDRNGTVSLNTTFNLLALHLGSNELFFKFLSPINTFSISDILSSGGNNGNNRNNRNNRNNNGGNGAGLSNFRAFNTTPLPPPPPPSAVPVPAAVWLFGSALTGLFGVSRKKLSV